ncbi:MAG: metallophosphoesterase family protein [Synechococcales cyanobacterium RM1_1_8]|nr:metallophosphoesterase family protein [Synechococcales cyanobacterium RM1_1_8]
MKTAVISCIHGNYEALDAVLLDIDAHQADQIVCLGDLVGYGPHPNAVVERIRSLDIPTVQGCWDEDMVHGLDACDCSYPSLLAEVRGKAAHAWTEQEIHPETREFLAQLPLSHCQDGLAFVHGSPHSQHEYLLPDMDAFTALERVLSLGADVLFCGHTHVPYVRELRESELRVSLQTGVRQAKSTAKTIVESATNESLRFPLKRIINAGSVGEPRHGRPNATYVLYDSEQQTTLLREVEYDYQKTCADILAKGLPPIFAWRLAQGLEFAERADDPSHVCER